MYVNRAALTIILALGAASACGYDSTGGGPVAAETISMNATNGSGVSGTARLDPQSGGGSTVTIQLQNVPPGAHAGHVHLGACANQGPVVFGLNAITPDTLGSGSATTTGIPNGFLGPAYSIEYHAGLNPPGDAIACADIPA
ncbi:MAG TPA: hypothetical protein VIW26_01925 [Gemmatimonadales bacterium]|jgi:hypothetical protein